MTDIELKEMATVWVRTHNDKGEALVPVMDWPRKMALAKAYLASEAKLERFMALVPLLNWWADEVCQASTMSTNDGELFEMWVALRDDLRAMDKKVQGKRGPL